MKMHATNVIGRRIPIAVKCNDLENFQQIFPVLKPQRIVSDNVLRDQWTKLTKYTFIVHDIKVNDQCEVMSCCVFVVWYSFYREHTCTLYTHLVAFYKRMSGARTERLCPLSFPSVFQIWFYMNRGLRTTVPATNTGTNSYCCTRTEYSRPDYKSTGVYVNTLCILRHERSMHIICIFTYRERSGLCNHNTAYEYRSWKIATF